MENDFSAVRAKMVCNNTFQNPNGTVYKVQLGCVYSTTGENASFTKFTPFGMCEMGIDADAPAARFFQPGKKYYVTFTEAPE